MKLIGKYNYMWEGKIKKKHYIVRRNISKLSRRILIFGPTGYGKNGILLRNAINSSENVLFISSKCASDELEPVPGLPEIKGDLHIYENCNKIKGAFTGTIAYDFKNIPYAKQEVPFYEEILPYLKNSKITERTDVTIIFSDLNFLTKHKEKFEEETRSWKCKIIVDLTCWGGVVDETPSFFKRRYWTLIPVFTHLFAKASVK